jgi:hypothetical protein
MPVKRKTRKTTKRVVKKATDNKKIQPEKSEPMEAKVDVTETKPVDMFPPRELIYVEEDLSSDPTELVKNGKPWDPKKDGYEVRFMSPEQVKVQGLRGYTPVPVESGIRIKNHPLTREELGIAGDFGSGVYMRLGENEPAQKELCSKELEEFTGGRSRYVKLNSSILCIAPLELAQARRRQATEISNNKTKAALMRADAEAQKDLGADIRRVGQFRLGRNAQISEVDGKRKTTKKVWSVPAKIK